ncbi:hypothetical protein [Luteitalea sp. TBR-22]|uniref:hypothetical protein n=1 Tax=Luteitalea sp. TBR-22 TaxID=2802971 RepID=UPI001EF674BB|nr:hypothetical protein [Luteitalea sp. TBR-22]
MSAPKHVTFSGPEAQQLSRVAATLPHLAKDLRKGTNVDTIARRLDEMSETLTLLIERAIERGTLH